MHGVHQAILQDVPIAIALETQGPGPVGAIHLLAIVAEGYGNDIEHRFVHIIGFVGEQELPGVDEEHGVEVRAVLQIE